MTDLSAPSPRPGAGNGWLLRAAGSRRFQTWAMRVPGLKRLVAREGAAMFDLVAGFCQSQVLMALVDLGTMERLSRGPQTAADLAQAAGVPPERMLVLLRAGAAAGLLRVGRTVRLTLRGGALLAVPGLAELIRHHKVLYRDLADPAAFFRGETRTELAELWPYVLGAGAAADPARAQRYSRLMSDSQSLIAEDTLALVDLRGVRHLMDIGGGTGTFLAAVAERRPELDLTLFDLPEVVSLARDLPDRIARRGGSFRDDSLPVGADAISLVRVLYDHDDATVRTLLGKVRAALPPGGRIVISEPMAGSRAGDSYYALYCMAMRTGRARTGDEIAALLDGAGFIRIRSAATRRDFVTSVIEAVSPS